MFASCKAHAPNAHVALSVGCAASKGLAAMHVCAFLCAYVVEPSVVNQKMLVVVCVCLCVCVCVCVCVHACVHACSHACVYGT